MFISKGEELGKHLSNIDRLEENRKCLLGMLYIKDMLLYDKTFSISTFDGRIMLYCLLLKHHFGSTVIKRCLDRVNKMAKKKEDNFKVFNAQNLLIPATLEELNLRLRVLMGATTGIHSIAIEGQKRMWCQTFSELGLRYSRNPIPSFYLLKKSDQFLHRPTPNVSDDKKFNAKLTEATRIFFSRGATPLRSYMFILGKNMPGVTHRVRKICDERSTKSAVQNNKVQEKTINSYIKEVLLMCRKSKNIYDAVYVPAKDETQKLPREKPVQEQNIFMKRWFTEVFAEMALDSENPDFTELYKPIVQRFEEKLGQFKDPDETVRKEMYLDPEHPKTKPHEKDIVAAMKPFVANRKDRNNKWTFTHPNSYDPILTKGTGKVCVPKDIDLTKCSRPHNLEWFFAYWAFNHKNSSHVTKWHQNFDAKWSPMGFNILTSAFSHCVFDETTMDEFISLVENNGLKETAGYLEGSYVHEVTTLDAPVSMVRDINQKESRKLVSIISKRSCFLNATEPF